MSTANKPEEIHRTFRAYAEPCTEGSGYVGVFHAPGMTEGRVLDDDGTPFEFKYKDDAEIAAKDRLFEIMNTARDMANSDFSRSKPEKYKHLEPNEFAQMLRESGLTTALFAEIYGTTVQRVMWWIDGRDKKGNVMTVPHPAYLLLQLMIDQPSIIDKLEDYTNDMTTRRSQPREGSSNGA